MEIRGLEYFVVTTLTFWDFVRYRSRNHWTRRRRSLMTILRLSWTVMELWGLRYLRSRPWPSGVTWRHGASVRWRPEVEVVQVSTCCDTETDSACWTPITVAGETTFPVQPSAAAVVLSFNADADDSSLVA